MERSSLILPDEAMTIGELEQWMLDGNSDWPPRALDTLRMERRLEGLEAQLCTLRLLVEDESDRPSSARRLVVALSNIHVLTGAWIAMAGITLRGLDRD